MIVIRRISLIKILLKIIILKGLKLQMWDQFFKKTRDTYKKLSTCWSCKYTYWDLWEIYTRKSGLLRWFFSFRIYFSLPEILQYKSGINETNQNLEEILRPKYISWCNLYGSFSCFGLHPQWLAYSENTSILIF